ncbi:MAG TPA: glutamine--tRNA ligase/YqeY domain fusion protein [Candidatus Omnitrophica bacterium]|nr:glutamine--tRNA ligase/YqeY domain fusion protein [Candidatus Omnitrophota bacterium]
MENFITEIIDRDLESTKYSPPIHTRFPPEPNGYLHIGHAKSICLNFGLASQYNGLCNLRFDDTNPSKEELEYVNSIKEDVKWLGFDWERREFYASDYFEKFYQYAVQLIEKGKAYVCDLTLDEIREYRGTLTSAGKESPYRNRSVKENIDLFRRMKNGEFTDGSRTLRAKIDMAHPNIVMRDPVLYRIKREHHHRTKDAWCIYPMYDFAHCLSDSIEGITHSICTLEFENNRPLYDWILDMLELHHPSQIEFARLNISNTILSKRKLLDLVKSKIVSGWDDPRMPTISGLRRRGYTPSSIRSFCSTIGVSKVNSLVDIALLENSLRQELNRTAPRRMAVLNPLEVIIENYPEDKIEYLDAVNNPEEPSSGSRKIIFSRRLYIEQDDFMENPPKNFYRLCLGREVRLRYGYFITCKDLVKDSSGRITSLICTYDPKTRGGDSPDNRKVKSTLHWVSSHGSVDAKVRLFDHLFSKPNPEEDDDFKININTSSLVVLENCKLENSLKSAALNERYQFERKGYFILDKDSTPDNLVFNLIVSLRDSWAKLQKQD